MSDKVKILFPTDFSESASNAFESAVHIAKNYEAELFLLHVMESSGGFTKIFHKFDEEAAREGARNELDKLIEEKAPGLDCEAIVKTGKAYKGIVEAATDLGVDLIVMGTHGADGMKELIAGSNASRVIRTAPCPVLSIRDEHKVVGFDKILLPIDLTKETGEKVKIGESWAKRFNAELIVLTILRTDDKAVHDRLEKRMKRAVEHIESNGIVKVSSHMEISTENVADAVMAYAKAEKVDIIAIMTQQELDFREQFMGSNASRIVNHANVPILSIKPSREYKSKTFSGSHFS